MFQPPSIDKINSNKAAQFPGKWHATNKISPRSLPSGVTDLELTTVIIEWRSCRKKDTCSYVCAHTAFFISHACTFACLQLTKRRGLITFFFSRDYHLLPRTGYTYTCEANVELALMCWFSSFNRSKGRNSGKRRRKRLNTHLIGL